MAEPATTTGTRAPGWAPSVEMPVDADAEHAADLCSRLIRFDTSNRGGGDARGERPAAEFVARCLADLGIPARLVERTPGRTNVLARVPGREPDLPAVLVQAHLDVVPADPADWTVPPFSGDIHGGYVWGRGATDMKDLVAILLTVLAGHAATGHRPRRDLVLAFVADEEDQGVDGAAWLVEHHADHFAGCGVAISETGAFTHHAGGVRLYPVGTAERGTAHLRLTAHGRAGHASRPNPDNPVTRLVGALHRIAAHEWPVRLTDSVRAYLQRTAAALGVPVDPATLATGEGVDTLLDALGAAGTLARTTVRAGATPTVLDAGYKVNVIPSTAAGEIDVRTLPGIEDDVLATIDALAGPGITREFVAHQAPVEAPLDTPWFTAMADALRAEDPGAVVVPYCQGGGTDAKSFATLGIPSYGFSPLWVPPDFDYRAAAHGVDERVPVAGLGFGVRVLRRFLEA